MIKVFYFGALLSDRLVGLLENDPRAFLLFHLDDLSPGNHDPVNAALLEGLRKKGRLLCLDSLEYEGIVDASFELDREKKLALLLSDFRLFLLKTRYTRVDLAGNFATVSGITDFFDSVFGLYHAIRPNVLFLSYTPHTVQSFIFSRVFELCGCKVIRLINGPLPWLMLPVSGLDNGSGHNFRTQINSHHSDRVVEYLKLLRGNYHDAMPHYERDPIGVVDFLQILNFFRTLSLRSLISQFEKSIIRREFRRAVQCSWINDSQAYIVYFLHYQPEMNTVPEAGFWADQYNIVRRLSSVLPSRVKIVVKEHPSTFSKKSDRRWRPKGFYSRFLSIPSVQICPIETDTFEMIDNALFVASISGVCLSEALARLVPVICFSSVRFPGFPNKLVFDASSRGVADLRLHLTKRLEGSLMLSYEEVVFAYEQVIEWGYDGVIDDSAFIPQNSKEAHKIADHASYLAVLDVMESK